MVLQRTIENLRERPKREREAVAFWIAVAVVAILLLGWCVYFFRSLGPTNLQPLNEAYNQAVQQAQAQQDTTPLPPDDTGWVSNAAQTPNAANAAAAGEIQIIQEDSATGTSYVAQ